MSTAASWTDRVDLREGWRGLRALMAFRSSSLSSSARRRLRVGAAMAVLLTGLVIAITVWLPGDLSRSHAGSALALLPSAMAAFLALAVVGAISAGGGRELVPRDQVVALPVSPVTDHLVALLLAPLNIGWLLQSWTLLGVTAYAVGTHHTAAALLPVALWIVAATALGQLVGWAVEGVRRGRHGSLVARTLALLAALCFVTLALTHQLGPALDHAPTVAVLDVVLAGVSGRWVTWALGSAAVVVLFLVAVVVGAPVAAWALGRVEREELRLESGHHPARRDARSDLAAMVRVDRGLVWRSVPLRRGIAVLTLLPGLVALLGRMEWSMLPVMPGLAASGAALLFGVNAWCLDGRGALWRDSLPVDPAVAHWARTLVLTETVLVTGGATTVLAVVGAALGHGWGGLGAAASLVCALLVSAGQVVAASMRWSAASPYTVDMRSARATPAPPAAMIGYSARLALVTTLTALLFCGTAAVGDTRLPVALAIALLCRSGLQLVRAARAWVRPEVRSPVITVVAA